MMRIGGLAAAQQPGGGCGRGASPLPREAQKL